MIAYRAMLDVTAELVGYVANLLHAERRRRGTRMGTRLATCRRQAVFVLTWFRKKDGIAVLGAGFGLSRATAYRYHAEGLQALAAQAPDLAEVLQQVKDDDWAYVILDGTIIDADRDAANDHQRQGKTDRPVVLRQDLAPRREPPSPDAPRRHPVWVSGVEPGSVHDLTTRNRPPTHDRVHSGVGLTGGFRAVAWSALRSGSAETRGAGYLIFGGGW
jgi:hypothetical protein